MNLSLQSRLSKRMERWSDNNFGGLTRATKVSGARKLVVS